MDAAITKAGHEHDTTAGKSLGSPRLGMRAPVWIIPTNWLAPVNLVANGTASKSSESIDENVYTHLRIYIYYIYMYVRVFIICAFAYAYTYTCTIYDKMF